MTATAQDKGKMLPGIAGIAMFMLFLTMINVYGALVNAFGEGRGKYGVLALCTLLAAGVFGLLRMLRWGWAIVLAGALLLGGGDLYFFTHTHAAFFLVRGFFAFCFFLYLVRPDVRDRMI